MNEVQSKAPWTKVQDDLRELRLKLADLEQTVAGITASSSEAGPPAAAGTSETPVFDWQRLSRIVSTLSALPSQSEILDALLAEAQAFTTRAVLFLRSEGEYEVWKTFGFPGPGLEQLRISSPDDPVLTAAAQQTLIEIEGPVGQQIPWLEDSGDEATRAIVLPVSFQTSVPLVFYGDRREPIDVPALEALFQLGRLVLQNNYLTYLAQTAGAAGEPAAPPAELSATEASPTAREPELVAEQAAAVEPPVAPEAEAAAPVETEAAGEAEADLTEPVEIELAAEAEAEVEPDIELDRTGDGLELDLEPEEGKRVETVDAFLGGDPFPEEDEASLSLTARQFLDEIARSENADHPFEPGYAREGTFDIVPDDTPLESRQEADADEGLSVLDELIDRDREDAIFDAPPPEQDRQDPVEALGEATPIASAGDLPAEQRRDEATQGDESDELPADLQAALEVSRAEEESLHDEARRFARLLVTEIKLYSEDDVVKGRQAGDLYTRLQQDIDRSRDMYEKRAHPLVRSRVDYLHQEMLRILAQDDPTLMGENYPGPRLTDFLDQRA